MTTTKNTKDIYFTTTKTGAQQAFRMDRSQHRSFRMPLEQAKLEIATGAARLSAKW